MSQSLCQKTLSDFFCNGSRDRPRGQLLVKELLVVVPRVVLVVVVLVPALALSYIMNLGQRELNQSLLSQRTKLRTLHMHANKRRMYHFGRY